MSQIAPQSIKPSSPDQAPVLKLDYSGTAGQLFQIYLVNFFLKIVTLSVYGFWGRTNIRRYLWSNLRFLKEPFAYLGTGGELLKSYAKYVAVFVLPLVVLNVLLTALFHGDSEAKSAAVLPQLFFFFGLVVLIYYSSFCGLRYRLGKTSWRGIRLQLRGDPWQFVGLQLKNLLLKIVTLGFYKPYADVAMLNYIVNNCYFGNAKFTYRGDPKELKETYLPCWLLILPTLGLSLVWYRAKFYAHLARYTRLGGMEFRCKTVGSELLMLNLTNALIMIFTLGLGYALMVQRRMEYAVNCLRFRGEVDFAQIAQAQKSAGGEGGDIYLGGDDLGF